MDEEVADPGLVDDVVGLDDEVVGLEELPALIIRLCFGDFGEVLKGLGIAVLFEIKLFVASDKPLILLELPVPGRLDEANGAGGTFCLRSARLGETPRLLEARVLRGDVGEPPVLELE